MKLFLKLAYCAFSSGFIGVFLHFWLKFKPFEESFPFQNVIANLSLCVAS